MNTNEFWFVNLEGNWLSEIILTKVELWIDYGLKENNEVVVMTTYLSRNR